MFCTKCGSENNNGENFCRKCGVLLNNQMQQQVVSENNINGETTDNYQSTQSSVNNMDSNYINQSVNPDMKKWAILSIVIPIVAMVWYWFIGLSFYLAVLIGSIGFSFANKGEMSDKKLATIGKVLNGMLFGMAIIMFIVQLMKIIAK